MVRVHISSWKLIVGMSARWSRLVIMVPYTGVQDVMSDKGAVCVISSIYYTESGALLSTLHSAAGEKASPYVKAIIYQNEISSLSADRTVIRPTAASQGTLIPRRGNFRALCACFN